MRVRLMPVLVLFLGAATAWAAQPDRPTTQPGAGGNDKGAMKAVSLDGEWTVVSAARDGMAVEKADKMTVTIRGNVVTFGGAGANDTAKMKALRLDFGSNGTVRVTEAGTDGKFGTGTGGTDRKDDKDNKGTQPGTAGGQPGNRNMPGPMSGVYVLTPEYLAISVFASGTGGMGTGGTRPGTGTTQPGTTQPGTARPGTTQPGTTQPGTGTTAGTGPQMRTHMSVILKRSGGSRP